MTVIDPAVTLQVSENDKVLEPYRPGWAGSAVMPVAPAARPAAGDGPR